MKVYDWVNKTLWRKVGPTSFGPVPISYRVSHFRLRRQGWEVTVVFRGRRRDRRCEPRVSPYM